MKVPTYTAQSDVTNRTGQTPLRVQANVGAATQAISAQADLFQQAQRTSMQFLEQETKLQRATELAALENNFAARLQEHNLAAMDDQNPTSMMTNWNESVKRTLNDLGRDISDPVVRRRFIASASNDILAGRLNIMKQARANRIDQSKATYLKKIDTLKKLAYNGNSVERMKAMRELYGSPGVDTGDAAFRSPAVVGVFQQMENLGLLSAAGRVELEMSTRVEMESGEIYQDLSAAAVSGNPDHADAIVRNLSNPDQYPNVIGSARNALLNKAISLRDSLEDDAIANEKAKIELQNKQQKQTQDKNNLDLTVRLSMQEQNPGGFTGERVTLREIDELGKAGKLNATDYKALKKRLMEGGPDQSNGQVMFDLRQDIDDAQDKNDLDEIRRDLPTFIANKSITTSDAATILKEIEQAETKTPRALAIKEQRKNLLRVLGVGSDGLIPAINAVDRVNQTFVINDALNTYSDLVNNQNVDPEEAYNYLARNFRNQTAFQRTFGKVEFLAPQMFLYDLVKGINGPITDTMYREIKKKINESGLAPRLQDEEVKTLDLIRELKARGQQNNTEINEQTFGNN
mgnify:FL=1